MATHQKKHIKSSGNTLSLRKKETNFEFYAVVKQPLGNCSFKCILLNNEEFTAKLCGKMKQKTRSNTVKAEDFVLVEKDSLESSKPNYTIVTKYSDAEKKELKKMGENVSTQIRINNTERNAGTAIHMESEQVMVQEVEREEADIDIDDI
jgi:translation initiation factor IF-1